MQVKQLKQKDLSIAIIRIASFSPAAGAIGFVHLKHFGECNLKWKICISLPLYNGNILLVTGYTVWTLLRILSKWNSIENALLWVNIRN